ncbi:MAG: MCE family protein [Pseudonocardiaceae bacterium]|nr:MCE family protein [Pseudonocardiaceae bacterium]
MISRLVRIQLLAFLVITVVGVSYVGVRYAGLERLVADPRYSVTMQLADSGGIFSGANVTYQGVDVGRVGELSLTDSGVAVELLIDKDTPPIPADLTAVVANLSAIGEQYVDLRPDTDAGPMLAAGSVIPEQATRTPVPIEEVLLNLDQLVRSVPLDSLRTTVDELGTAFSDTGPELEALLDSNRLFTEDAVDALPETLTLIRDGRTVLDTQNDPAQASAIISFSRDLRLLAGQLKESDPDLRRLIDTAPRFSVQATELLRESGPGIGELVADLLTLSRIAEPRVDSLEQILVTYPAVTSTAYTTTPGDGTTHLGLVLDSSFDPFPCGLAEDSPYQETPKRPGTDLRPIPANTDAFCEQPRGSEISVRGSQNVPRAGVPEPAAPDNPPPPAPGSVPGPAPESTQDSAQPSSQWSARSVPGPGAQPRPVYLTDLASVLRQ